MSGLKRKLAESDAQRSCKVSCVGFDHSGSPCPVACSYHFHPRPPAIVENCHNFLKSGLPYRIMYYQKGEWCDFPEPMKQAFIEGFKAKKSANEVSVGGKSFLIDFLAMVFINLRTGNQRSIAWIDESDKCFFPISFFDDVVDDAAEFESETVCTVVQSPMATASQPEIVKSVVENEAAVPPQTLPPNFLCTTIETLERSSEGYMFVHKLFLSGMGSFVTQQNIMHIHRYVPKDASAKVRLEGFEKQIKTAEELRGNANVKYGWYGAGKQDIVSVMVHGFGSDGKHIKEGVLGTGIYLMPENRAFASMNQCDGDEKGLQYMILCRAILGNTEQIQQDSKQYCPSNQLYDSGVDDISCPKCYVIWSTHLKTYIHPEYMITFKLAPDVEEYLSGLKDTRFLLPGTKLMQDFTHYPVRQESNTSPWMSFTVLLSELQHSVSPREMELLHHHHGELKNKIITRGEFIKMIKAIVGQELLMPTLQRLMHHTSSLGYSDSTAQKLDCGLPAALLESDESAETAIKPNDTAFSAIPDNHAGLTKGP